MVLYVCSKKGLAMPPSLPPPLHSFLLNAPSIPSNPNAPAGGSGGVPHIPNTPPPSQPSTSTTAGVRAPSPSASAAPIQKASISSAFDFETPANDMPLPGHTATTTSSAPSVAASGSGGNTHNSSDSTAEVRIKFVAIQHSMVLYISLLPSPPLYSALYYYHHL